MRQITLRNGKKSLAAGAGVLVVGAALIGISLSSASSPSPAAVLPSAATPIEHVVVIFPENISFDHYFGTYPNATNPAGEPQFHALAGTPAVNGLSNGLLDDNPNEDNPKRLGPAEALTCDQNHSYTPEQEAFDDGLMNDFVQKTTGSGCTQSTTPDSETYGPSGIVMDYYDGNTVTGLWNYAQHFSLNDNSYDDQFGPSSPGAINLVSGDTEGAEAHGGASSSVVNGVLQGDGEPYFDQCSNASKPLGAEGLPTGVTVSLSGKNIGNLMDEKDVTWGWFQGGFTPSAAENAAHEKRAVCGTAHKNIGGASVTDYVQHHEPFQYYESHRQPRPRRAELARPGRLQRPVRHETGRSRQPPVRPLVVQSGGDRRQHAAGLLPQAAGVRERPRRLLRSARRTAVPGRRDQRDRAVEVLAEHRDRDRLRRLRRLV